MVPEIPHRRKTTWWLFLSHQTLLLLAMVRTLVLVPVYLKFISGETFGAWLAIAGVIAVLGMADFGLSGLMLQRIAQLLGSGSLKLLGRTVVSTLLFVSFLAATLALLLWAFAPRIPGWFGLTTDLPELVLAFRLAAADASLLMLAFTTGDILVGWHHPQPYMAGQIISQGLGILITLATLYRGWGVVAIPVGMLTGSALTLMVNLVSLGGLLRRSLPAGALNFDSKVLWEVLKASSYLGVTRACRLLAFRVQGLIVLSLISAPAVVVFEITRRAALTVGDIITRLPMSLLPGLAHLWGSRELGKFREIALSLLLSAGVAGLLGQGGVFLFNREFVALWVGEAFYGGAGLNFLLAAAGFVSILNAALFNLILAQGHFRLLTQATLLEVVLLLGLASLAGNFWQLEGVALAGLMGGLAALGLMGLGMQNFPGLRLAGSQLFQLLKGLSVVTMYVLLAVSLAGRWPPQGWCQLFLGAGAYLLAGALMLVCGNSQVRHLVFANFPFSKCGRLVT